MYNGMRSPSPSDVHHDATNEVNSGDLKSFSSFTHSLGSSVPPSLTPTPIRFLLTGPLVTQVYPSVKYLKLILTPFLVIMSPHQFTCQLPQPLPPHPHPSCSPYTQALTISLLDQPEGSWVLSHQPEKPFCAGNILTLKYSHTNLVISNLFWFPNAKYLPNWNSLARPWALSIIQLQSVVPPFSTLLGVNSPLSSLN